jgi:hypothetical protein
VRPLTARAEASIRTVNRVEYGSGAEGSGVKINVRVPDQ